MTFVPAVSRLLATELADPFFIPFIFVGFYFLWLWLSLIFRINFHFQFDHNVGRSWGSLSGCWCSLFHYWTLGNWDTLSPTFSNDRTRVINCGVDYARNEYWNDLKSWHTQRLSQKPFPYRKCMYSPQNFYGLYFEVSVIQLVLRRWKANV